jgi:hypothetical protein
LEPSRWPYRDEPRVWVFRRQVRVEDSWRMRDTDPLVTALWKTLPKTERRRTRLFACCADCPVRFTKVGAIADAYRHDERGLRMYDPPTEKELLAARLRRESPPPELDLSNDFERDYVSVVWNDLKPQHRRTLYALWRPGGREWALEGCSSPQAWASRVRSAERALARALGRTFCPGEYDLPGPGRYGFDYDRFFSEWSFYE